MMVHVVENCKVNCQLSDVIVWGWGWGSSGQKSH